MTDRRQPEVVQTHNGFLQVSAREQENRNPVVQHVAVYKTRARMLDDTRLEKRAQELQAAYSYAAWDGLSDDDKELWRHMARLDLC